MTRGTSILSFHTNHRLLLWTPVSVFLALSLLIAVLPASRLALSDDRAYRPDVAHGRAIYQREGCAYCHTQQVRMDTRQPPEHGRFPPLAQDARYGRPSQPEDYSGDDPPLLGTERTGPDLHNVGGRLPSPEWHLAHLFDPRAVVPSSVMPAYAWYFKTKDVEPEDRRILLPEAVREKIREKYGAVDVWATKDAQDLVAYLLSLKTGETPSR